MLIAYNKIGLSWINNLTTYHANLNTISLQHHTNEPHEDGHVVGDDLGRVEVTQRPHEHLVLGPESVAALELARHHEDGLDGTQAPIVVVLLRQ